MTVNARDSISEVARVLALECEKVAAAAGWDQPALLFEVVGQDVEDFLDSDSLAADDFAFGFKLTQVAELLGHPAEVLVGHVASPEALAACLVAEGWDYPERVSIEIREGRVDPGSLPPPSEFPDRREMRISTLVFRDGTAASASRRRGGEPETLTHGEMGGRVVRALRRYIGRPADSLPETSPAAVAAHVLATAGLFVVENCDNPLLARDPLMGAVLEAVEFAVPSAATLPSAFAQATCQLLSAPADPAVALYIPALLRPSWEGVRAALLEHRPDEDGFEPEVAERMREWFQMITWADDSYLAHRILEEACLPSDVSVRSALKRFNTALLTAELSPAAARVRDTYRAWLRYLVASFEPE